MHGTSGCSNAACVTHSNNFIGALARSECINQKFEITKRTKINFYKSYFIENYIFQP